MRLIDADKLKKDVLDLQDCYNGFSDTYDKACIIGVIDEQPTIEPERKKGRWIKGGEQPYFRKHFDIVVCSKCNKRGEHRWNFCPYCGADMRGEEDD